MAPSRMASADRAAFTLFGQGDAGLPDPLRAGIEGLKSVRSPTRSATISSSVRQGAMTSGPMPSPGTPRCETHAWTASQNTKRNPNCPMWDSLPP